MRGRKDKLRTPASCLITGSPPDQRELGLGIASRFTKYVIRQWRPNHNDAKNNKANENSRWQVNDMRLHEASMR